MSFHSCFYYKNPYANPRKNRLRNEKKAEYEIILHLNYKSNQEDKKKIPPIQISCADYQSAAARS